MHQPFFPDPVFGWVFYLALLGLAALASYTDLRKMVVPKWITITGLILGFLLNLSRGLWLGLQDKTPWGLPPGAGMGALYGFLFALTGFLVAFGLFLVLWLLGTCGGGDVKLFAALGAWVGPYMVIWVFGGSIVALMVVALCWLGYRAVTAKSAATPQPSSTKTATDKNAPRKKLRLTYSLPVALATAIVILWILQEDLRLAPPVETPQQKVQANAR